MSEAEARVFNGLILGYLRSRARTYHNVVLVKVLGGVRGDNLVGCKAQFVDRNGNRYSGRVVGVHGSKGEVVKVRFKPNIPGQAINATIAILCGRGSSNV